MGVNSHPYHPFYLYRAPVVQDRITLNIKRLQGDDSTIKRLFIHENLLHGYVIYVDRVIMHSKTTEFFDIPYPLPEYNRPVH